MDAFVARQPIFDRKQNVVAYELLFRSGIENRFDAADGDHATSKVISDSFLLFGIDKMTGGKKAFINFTHELLTREYVTLLPEKLLVVEILENIKPTEELLAACRKLKQQGYILALDDFVYSQEYDSLLALADIIKVDFMAAAPEERQALARRFMPKGIKMLAEKVETQSEFQEAMDMGYSYFQGYFFARPVIISGRDIPAFKLNYLRMLKELNQPDFDLIRVENIIKTEVSLSYKLLKYLNSAFFGFRAKITSIRQAVTLLGENETRKWASLMTLSSMGEDKPFELLITAIARAKFCEMLAPHVGLKHRAFDLFLLGMFSVIDALMDRPLEEILKEISLVPDVEQALLGERNSLREVYDLILAYEKSDWTVVARAVNKFRLDDTVPPEIYLSSLEWADQIFHA